MRSLANLHELATARGITIEDRQGDLGYWACFFDIPCHPDASAEFRAGWDECDDEMRAERASC